MRTTRRPSIFMKVAVPLRTNTTDNKKVNNRRDRPSVSHIDCYDASDVVHKQVHRARATGLGPDENIASRERAASLSSPSQNLLSILDHTPLRLQKLVGVKGITLTSKWLLPTQAPCNNIHEDRDLHRKLIHGLTVIAVKVCLGRHTCRTDNRRKNELNTCRCAGERRARCGLGAQWPRTEVRTQVISAHTSTYGKVKRDKNSESSHIVVGCDHAEPCQTVENDSRNQKHESNNHYPRNVSPATHTQALRSQDLKKDQQKRPQRRSPEQLVQDV